MHAVEREVIPDNGTLLRERDIQITGASNALSLLFLRIIIRRPEASREYLVEVNVLREFYSCVLGITLQFYIKSGIFMI